ncbi:MAG: hypothetical protein U9R57_12905, partial [Thermodesulfobacteriota bacterium]|nr:hypothetical protein [Thermodesulfobacteriota bacterium]
IKLIKIQLHHQYLRQNKKIDGAYLEYIFKKAYVGLFFYVNSREYSYNLAKKRAVVKNMQSQQSI